MKFLVFTIISGIEATEGPTYTSAREKRQQYETRARVAASAATYARAVMEYNLLRHEP